MLSTACEAPAPAAPDGSRNEDMSESTEIAGLFKITSHEDRLRILQRLAEAPAAVGELSSALLLDQPTVSRHLGILREHGLVEARQRSRKRIYSLTDQPAVHRIRRAAPELFPEDLPPNDDLD